jgi:EspA/EspE family
MGLLDKLASLGKAVWDTGKEVVGVVGDLGAVVDGAGAVGDLIERIGKAAHLDDVVDIGGRLAGWAERVGLNKFLRAADSPILDGGQLVIAGMKLTTGIGEPDGGERFGLGGARHRDVTATLRSAGPTADWSGAGANSYAGQNVKQTTRTEALAAADHEVHRVLATAAFQVNFHRGRLDDWYNWLADVGLVTYAIGLIPEVGQALKSAADAQAVLAAVGSCSLELYQLSSEVGANTAALEQLVGRYEHLGQTTNLWSTGPDPDPSAPPPPAPSGQPPSQKPPSEGPGEDQPPGEPVPRIEEAPVPSAPAPRVPSAGGGGGSPTGGEPQATPPELPEGASAPEPQALEGARAPAVPAASGGMPPGPMTAAPAPAAAAAGIPVGLIKEAVEAAMKRAAEEASEKDKEKDEDKDEKDEDEKDEDHDGKPDKPLAAAGGVESGRAPVHLETDVDPERLNTPMTVRLDRENPIGPPPVPTP